MEPGGTGRAMIEEVCTRKITRTAGSGNLEEERMVKNHGPQIKDDKTYEKLREQGESKEKAARIANAKASPSQHPSRKGGKAAQYEDWSVDDLQRRAREIGIEGRSKMKKDELIRALRNH